MSNVLTFNAPCRLSTDHVSVPDDAALIDEAQRGARWALEALFRRHQPMMTRLAFRLAPWPDEADDIVQDAALSAFAALDRVDASRPFEAWLRTIVVRTALKRMRRHRLKVRLGLSRAMTPLDVSRLVSPHAPPDIAAELHNVYGHLTDFPANERVTLLLRRVERCTIAEIAAQMDVSTSTVKRTLQRADRRMQRLLWEGGS